MRLSLDEWFDLPEDEPGELVDGRLEEEEEPDYLHELLVARLGRILCDWIFPQGGLVAGSNAKFAVASRRGRKPDVTVYLPGSRRPPARGLIRIPPDIAIEIVSPTPRDGRRDRVEKTADYATFGVAWYWLLDPQLRSLEILQLDSQGRYVHVLGASTGTLEKIPGCEGLTLDLDALWAAVDSLE
ncbi:MAG TPA: Uma2 family endonuclease [Thermoanaerobaculia bacterium]|nr:Uma2 family endonuclease [Thermoanaerobaculia bacterium]